MVKIEYVPNPLEHEKSIHECERIADFICEGFSREELIDLRFYWGDLLGEEIDTSNGEFINISEGVVTVTHFSKIPQGPETWIPLIVSFVISVVAAALVPTPSGVPEAGSRTQVSSTNLLGKSNNEPRINQRIDDLFGFVPRHTPPLWQQPYRIGIDNQEVEVLFVCVGRGKYEINVDRIFDGDTQYQQIPNGALNVYEPGTYPGNGSPSIVVGELINQDIGIYRQSNDLNTTELLPPNDLDVAAVVWRITTEDNGDGTYTVSLFASNAESVEIDLTTYLTAGEDFSIRDFYKTTTVGTVNLYRYEDPDWIPKSFNDLSLDDLSGSYVSDTVTSDTVTFTTSNADWDGLVNFTPVTNIWFAENNYTTTPPYVGFFTLDSEIDSDDITWYTTDVTPTENDKITARITSYYPSVGSVTNNIVGPVIVPKGVTKLLLNYTSLSGFYKLSSNTEVAIVANIEAFIEELDNNGDPIPGSDLIVNTEYKSNDGNVRFSVYQTQPVDVSSFSGDLRITCRRTTNRDKGNNISNVDKVDWNAIYSFEPIPVGHDFGDVTLMHCYIPSNSQSQLTKERRINLDVTRKITQYLGNGSFGPVESYATDQFDQIMVHTALDKWIGRLNVNQFNADGFLLLRQQIIDYFGSSDMCRFGYDFDTTQMSYQDTFKLICEVVNCIPYTQLGVYDAFFEKRQDTSRTQITHRNKIQGSEKRTEEYFRKYDGVELTYRDELSAVNETIYIPTDRSSTNPERIELPGCVSELQAYRRALRLYNKQRYQYVSVEMDVDEFGRVIIPGQRLDSPDGTRFTKRAGVEDGYRIYDGEVVEVTGLIVELSQPVEFVQGEDHYIQFTTLNGDNSEAILCSAGEDEFTIVMTTVPVEALYDGYQRDKTKFTFCSAQARESIALIPRTIDSRIQEGKEVNTISSVNYDHRYYQGDLENPQ